MRPANRQKSRNQYTCAHKKSSRRGTATASLKTLNAFKWGTLAISFYHPAFAKPRGEEGSCVCSFTGIGPGRNVTERAIPFWYWSFDDAAPIWDVTGKAIKPCYSRPECGATEGCPLRPLRELRASRRYRKAKSRSLAYALSRAGPRDSVLLARDDTLFYFCARSSKQQQRRCRRQCEREDR